MRSRTKEHIIYYLFLLIILALASIVAMRFAFNKQLQMLIVVITTIFYIGLGIVHHKENHDLMAKIVIEYVLIGSLGIMIIFFLLKGGL